MTRAPTSSPTAAMTAPTGLASITNAVTTPIIAGARGIRISIIFANPSIIVAIVGIIGMRISVANCASCGMSGATARRISPIAWATTGSSGASAVIPSPIAWATTGSTGAKDSRAGLSDSSKICTNGARVSTVCANAGAKVVRTIPPSWPIIGSTALTAPAIVLKKFVRVAMPSALCTQVFSASAPAPNMPRSGPPLAAMAEKTPLTIPPKSWTKPQKLLSVSSACSKYSVRDPSWNPATIFWAQASAISEIFSESAETIGEAAAPAATIP